MEPEQGNEMLFVVREANLDLTLVAETLYSSRADLISRQLLEPVKALGFRIRAVVSDADKNIRRAVEVSLPGGPHQACQVHCLCDAGEHPGLPREVRQFLERLEQEATERPDEAKVIANILKAVRNRWWGLFICYRVSNVPSSNNDLETFFKDIKHHQRRITGRKSVREFILRYGPFAAFIVYAESFDDLLARLRQVKPADFKQARQALRKIQLRLKKLYRFRHHPDEYYRDLGTRWEQAILPSR